MRRQIATFLALAALSSAAAAEKSLPWMSIECATQTERLTRACPIGGDQRAFQACKQRNADLISRDCIEQARVRMQAVRQTCRSGPVGGGYQNICSALNR